MPRNSASPGETSAYTYPGATPGIGGGPGGGGVNAGPGAGGGVAAAGAGACSAQKTVPNASRRHSSHTALPHERQYAVAGTSGWFWQFIRLSSMSLRRRGGGGRLHRKLALVGLLGRRLLLFGLLLPLLQRRLNLIHDLQ